MAEGRALDLSIFTNITFLMILSVAVAAGIVVVLLIQPKANMPLGFERLKPGFDRIHKGKFKKGKDASDYEFTLQDGRKFTVPKEKAQEAELIDVPKGIRLKKGITRLFLIENGQLTTFNGKLAEQTNPLLDNESVSAVVNRASLRRLASLKAIFGNRLFDIFLGVAVGVVIGIIAYPYFIHPQTVYVQVPPITTTTGG